MISSDDSTYLRPRTQHRLGVSMRLNTATCLSFALLTACSVSGCATKSSVHKVQDEAKEAHRISEQALTTAQEANNRSIRTEEMVNRSFRHSMRK